jgi:hypothetical protein
MIFDATDSTLKKGLASDLIEQLTTEQVQDVVGAMVSSNTETGVAVSYEDGDGTLDFVLATAQPTVTSLGTLTTLTVDDITINGSEISDAGDLTLNVGGDIILDADGGDIRFSDGGTQFGIIFKSSNDLALFSTIQDGDLLFRGNDGGTNFTALTLDMSEAGAATFNNKVVATELDISGNIDVDGTANLDNTDIDGTLNTSGVITAQTSANISQVAITSSSNAVAWDAAAAANAYHVTTENTTFSAPSNAVEGAIIQVELAQGGTARTIAWNTVFEFAASTAPTVTATANKTDIFTFRYNGSVWQEIGRVQNLAQT